jgi:cytochrome c
MQRVLHRTLFTALALPLLLAAAGAHATPAENDQAMVQLATERGCLACHSVLPAPARADGLPPIAPAWRDIALKYRDDPTAYVKLTRVVMDGADPQGRHWVGKVGAANMPPNASVVTPEQARMLVNWILVLVP